MAIDTTRVTTWQDFIGQTDLKARLRVHIEAALSQSRALEHVLLAGPPGFGKTALATIIADELKAHFESFTMPVNEATIVDVIEESNAYGDSCCVVLLDEIHRATKKEQEFLLPLLEFGHVQDRQGDRFQAEALTVIAATTEPDKVIPPLWDRFPVKPSFDPYSDEEMGRIVTGMAAKLKIEMDEQTAVTLGRATAGIPRNARQFVLASRDLEISSGTRPTADDVLKLCRVDTDGLTHQHVAYLGTLKQLGGKTGLKNIQNIMRLPEAVVRELERHLLTLNLVTYTDRGRELTSAGHRKMVEIRGTQDGRRPALGATRRRVCEDR